MSNTEHKQVCVKVNAYVDEKIAPVIEAMSKLYSVVTFQSCQNLNDDGLATIWFRCKDEYGNWMGIGEICETLSQALTNFEYAKISVEWQLGTNSYPCGYFEFEMETADDIAKALEEILKH